MYGLKRVTVVAMAASVVLAAWGGPFPLAARSALAAERQADDGESPGTKPPADKRLEDAERVLREGGTVVLKEDGTWTSSGTGDVLAGYEKMPGGRAMVRLGRKIIVAYRRYLDMLMDFMRRID